MTPEFDRVLQIGILRSCRCAEAAWIIPMRLTLMPKRHHSETFSNFFRNALRLPAGIAAMLHVLPPASVAAEYEDWPEALGVRGDQNLRPREIGEEMPSASNIAI